MKFARIASAQAVDALFPLVDEDISIVEREEAMAAEVAELDRLIEEAEREWVAADVEAAARVARDGGQKVPARRARRRAGRELLRSLPVGLEVAEVVGVAGMFEEVA